MEVKTIFFIVVILILLYIVIYYVTRDVNTLTSINSAETMQTITAGKLSSSAQAGQSSNFSYSIWVYIDDWNYKYGEPKVIFGRMTSDTLQKEPCPSVVLGPIQNNVIISLAVYPNKENEIYGEYSSNVKPFSSDLVNIVGGCKGTHWGCCPNGKTTKIDEAGSNCNNSNYVIHNCAIPNIPIQKWVNLFISVYGRTLDVYMDGKLVRTSVMPGVAKIDGNAPVYVTPNGGFSGFTSKFSYWPDASDPQTVWNVYKAGYGGSWLGNMFNKYSVKVALMNGQNESSSITL